MKTTTLEQIYTILKSTDRFKQETEFYQDTQHLTHQTAGLAYSLLTLFRQFGIQDHCLSTSELRFLLIHLGHLELPDNSREFDFPQDIFDTSLKLTLEQAHLSQKQWSKLTKSFVGPTPQNQRRKLKRLRNQKLWEYFKLAKDILGVTTITASLLFLWYIQT